MNEGQVVIDAEKTQVQDLINSVKDFSGLKELTEGK